MFSLLLSITYLDVLDHLLEGLTNQLLFNYHKINSVFVTTVSNIPLYIQHKRVYTNNKHTFPLMKTLEREKHAIHNT